MELNFIITTKEKARVFLRAAVAELGMSFHPDTPARDYVFEIPRGPGRDPEEKDRFTLEQAAKFDRARLSSLKLLGDEAYDVAFEEIQKVDPALGRDYR